MTAPHSARILDLAIIGGGAAGVLAAIHALHAATQALRIALIEPHGLLAEGVAYATRYPEHLLNVPAGKMSGFAEQPQDFLDYLCEQQAYPQLGRPTLAATYVSRLHYAGYLQLRLQQAVAASAAQLEVVHDRALTLEKNAAGFALTLQQGDALQASTVILAVGNALRPLPARGASALSEQQRIEAWDFDAVRGISTDSDICIIGSGLSMADSIVSLADRGHDGVIHVISRHALLPLPHTEGAPAEFDPQPLLAMNLRQRMHALRAHVAAAAEQGIPWQSVMDRIRPLGQTLWQSLSFDDQRRFLRHVVRYWDVHRHRIAKPVYAQLQQRLSTGRLRLHRGRLETVIAEGACVQVAALDARRRPLQLEVQCVINATGVEMRAQAMRNPLLQQMLGSGLAGPGPHGIGLDSTVDGSVLNAEGVAEPRLQLVGSLRIGRLWESLAIPELRTQAQQAATTLLKQLQG